MSDARDDQDLSEDLDDDNLDPEQFPPDRPLGLHELTTEDVQFADEYAPDSVSERSWREEPDVDQQPIAYSERESVAGLLEPDRAGGDDVEADLIADEAEADDDVGGVVLSDVAEGHDPAGTRPAEEAAVHREGD